MAKKTWKIGECCQGGIISVDVRGTDVMLYLKEWDFSKGSNRGSDQSGAKVINEFRFMRVRGGLQIESRCYDNIEEVLNDWTTCFYADQIMTWINNKLKGE